MQKNVQSLIKQIKEYNKSYRLGEDTISDQEYDSLVEELKNLDKDSYEKLREKLFEEKGSFKHKFIIGSLDKIKAGDIKTLDQWKKCIDKTSNLIITPKLDGLSIVLYYTKGKLTHAVTRGDAEYGELQTDKLKLIVPNTLPSKETCIIRGECILSNNNFEKLKNVENKEFKNPRNAAVGLINSKKFNEESIKCLSFIAYQILKSNEPKNLYVHKLEHLKELGFTIPVYTILTYKNLLDQNLIDWYNEFSDTVEYVMDGLVIQVNDKEYENKKYPDFTRAFKMNELVAETELKDIKWNLSKSGYFIPVGIINPVQLGGATIQKVSLFNKEYLIKNKLGIGSKIIVHKAGDIIPYIKEILSTAEVVLPDKCPYCNTTLEHVSVDLHCPNEKCPIQVSKQVAYFLKNLNVEVASETSLVNWGIMDFKNLLDFKPDEKSKNQNKFYSELKLKLFTSSPKKLIACMDFDGVSLKTFKQLFKHYFTGPIEDFIDFFNTYVPLSIWANKVAKVEASVKGVSAITINNVKRKFKQNYEALELIVSDPRYIGDNKDEIVNTIFEGKSFCFTGSFDEPRANYESLVEQLGGEVMSSVSKNLSYLVSDDPKSTSTKMKKAKELSIPILTLSEFKALCHRLSLKK